MAGSVSSGLRGPSLRSDQHVFRVCSPRGRETAPRLQPGQAPRLCAGGNRLGDHAGGFADRLRGHGRQYQREDDAQGFPAEDRETIRQGESHLGDGPRDSHRGNATRDAYFRGAGIVLGRNPAWAVDQIGEEVSAATLATGERIRRSQTAAARRRAVYSGPQPGPATKRAGYAAPTAQTIVATTAGVTTAEADPR